MTNQELIDFETDIGESFNAAKIRAPIHLYHGNEDLMQMVFKFVNPTDWVCATWRNHYQCLLKGVPAEELKQKILAGKSMVMNLPEHRIVCSSIVGGIPSIAVGLAAGVQPGEHVWCWLGDMSAETGAFHEAYKFAVNHNLPITFVVEDNHQSVMTPTGETWGRSLPWYLIDAEYHNYNGLQYWSGPNLIYYQYTNNKYPHAGAGVRVQF